MQVYVKLGTLADFFLTYVTHWLGGTFSKFMKKSSLVCWFLRGKHWFSFGLFHLVYFHRLVMTFRKNINAYFNKVESFCPEEVSIMFLDAAVDESPPLQQRRTCDWCSYPWQNSRCSVSWPLLFVTCVSPTPELFPSTCQSAHALNLQLPLQKHLIPHPRNRLSRILCTSK